MKSTVLTFALLLPCAALLAAEPAGVEFDGMADYAVVEDGALFDLDAFTLAACVKLDKTAGAQIVLGRGESGQLFTLYVYSDTVRMLVEYAPEKYTHANVPVPPAGKWVHLAGSYDGQTIKLYVDGKLAAETKAVGRIAKSDAPLMIGAVGPGSRTLDGRLDRVCVFSEALSDNAVARLAGGDMPKADSLVAFWTAESAEEEVWKNAVAGGPDAARKKGSLLICRKENGYRGIWYSNQAQGDEYVFKYSGGLGTYCAKHRPFAVYAPEVDKTFFCYGGTEGEGSKRTLLHMVSYYDHKTGMVPRPLLLLDKHTDDAHDNPVISMDEKGHIWIFSSSHGTGRPSFVSVSKEPYSIDDFELVHTTNFSYTQPYYLHGQGFFFLHTRYGDGGRQLFQMTSPDGRTWSEGEKLAMIEKGHYQVSWPCGNKVGTAFNMHPSPDGLNWRTNLYYMETEDLGKTWKNVQGERIELPLTEVDNPALVHDFRREKRNVYMKDVAYDAEGRPVILVLTSGGWESGPIHDPRTWQTARWTGSAWEIRSVTNSDNNYDTGSLYVEDDGLWRIIGPTEPGPQRYNTGGEVAIWTSSDQGTTWKRLRQLTHDSEMNHGYCRKPINAHPDFYALWADGHGRQLSESRLYFCNRDGSKVYMLPVEMEGEFARPVPVQ
jgi:hypothetical protein